jgi:hypothetical protein
MKIPSTKTSRIAVGAHKYKLEPAKSRSHYGETGHGTEVHYAFPSKKADEAWFVSSDWSGKKIGLLYQWSDGEWSFQKIQSTEERPRWLQARYDDVPAMIYIVSAHLLTGPTPEAAIAHAEGIPVPPPPQRGMTKKKSAQLTREIDEMLVAHGIEPIGGRR